MYVHTYIRTYMGSYDVTVMVTVFWYVTPCSLVDMY